MKKLFIILTALISTLASFGQQQIPLGSFPSTANIVRGEDAYHLFDGDFNTTYNPTFPSWSSMFTPVVTEILAYVKSSKCIPRQLKYVQQTGDSLGTRMYFVNKTTGEKKLIYTFAGQGGYMPDTWRVYNIPDSLQFDVSKVTFEAPGGGPAYPSEVQLLGDYTAQNIVLKDRTPLPLTNLLGFVCYPWNTALAMWPSTKQPFDVLRPARIRVYDDYTNVFDGLGNVSLHWDQFNQYKTLKNMGVQVKDCIQNHPDYPYPLGDSTRQDPATYLNFARALQRYAVANQQAGAPVTYIQAENELDRSWRSPAEYMDGYAIAAFCSACYDGHKGKYFDAGVKQAGPVKFVNPGCATDKTQILYQMLEWTVKNRGYRPNGSVDFPFDVYEFHWYQSLGGQYAGKPGGMPPELVIGRVQEIVDFFRRYCPEMEINIGEYGLDINQYSDLNAPAFGPYNAQQSRGIWIVRDLLLYAMLGIDASDYYRETMDWIDDPSDPTGHTNLYDQDGDPFATMDMITPNQYAQPAIYTRRIVGDYFRQIGDLLRQGYVFDAVVSTSPYVFRFKKPDGATAYFLWNLENVMWPSSGGRAIITENHIQYALNVRGAQLRRFVDSSDTMSTVSYNGESIDVNSKAVVIAVPPMTALPVHLISFTADKFTSSVVLKWIVQDAAKVEAEKSSDGFTWTNLGEGILNKLVDMHPLAGKNFYRLKMYEADGSFTRSPMKMIVFGNGAFKVSVVDGLGRTILKTQTTDLELLKQTLKSDSRIKPGFYLLQVTGNPYCDKLLKQ